MTNFNIPEINWARVATAKTCLRRVWALEDLNQKQPAVLTGPMPPPKFVSLSVAPPFSAACQWATVTFTALRRNILSLLHAA